MQKKTGNKKTQTKNKKKGGAIRSLSIIPDFNKIQNGGAVRSLSIIPDFNKIQNGGAIRSLSIITNHTKTK